MEILLYGPRKAGTTLFQRLLDGGDEIFVHPGETKIKKFLKFKTKNGTSASLDPKDLTEQELQSYFRATRKGWDRFNDDHYFNFIYKKKSGITSLSEYVNTDIAAARQGFDIKQGEKSGWAIKEISGHTTDIVNKFLEAFPRGRIILIYRDPRYVARAVYREKIRTGTKVDLKKAIKIAREPYKIYEQLKDYKDDSRVLRVDYENYTQHPERVMNYVANFLNIPFQDIYTKPTINGVNCIVPSASKKTEKIFKPNESLSKGISGIHYLIILLFSWIYRTSNKRLHAKRKELMDRPGPTFV